MTDKTNISHIHDCFGCGVCGMRCPTRIIEMGLNAKGFYEPHITDETKCVHCGVCTDVCAFSHSGLALPDGERTLESWAAWSDEAAVRRKCSSGGIGFEIARQLMARGYKAVVCRYNAEKGIAEHYIAETPEELLPSIGSKYMQSLTEEAFARIDRKGRYLVTGTPCQIDSFRRMVRRFRCEDRFVLMDFFCHCVPSMLAWKAYTRMVGRRVGSITYASWRNKFEYGWHDSWLMALDGERTGKPVDWHAPYGQLIRERRTSWQSRMSQGDLYYRLFLGDLCLNSACERQCKYKYDQSSADLRIGDLWGSAYRHDQEGVSALIAFTEKGRGVVGSLRNVTLTAHPFELVAEGQMKANARHKALAPLVMRLLRHGERLDGTAFRAAFLGQRVISKLARILKR